MAVDGGDGTIQRRSTASTAGACAGVIPLGNANVVAADNRHALYAAGISGVIAGPPVQEFHWGKPTAAVVMMAGVGFDAGWSRRMQPAFKRRGGGASYVLMFPGGLFKFYASRFSRHGRRKTHGAASAVIANGHFFTGRHTWRRCPPGRAVLYVCLFLRPGAAAALRTGYYAAVAG